MCRDRHQFTDAVSELLSGREVVQDKTVQRVIERIATTKQRVMEELAKIGFATIHRSA